MKVHCVVDDAVQRGSPFWAEHGLAFLIETEAGRVLFDTDQSGTVLSHNLELLGVDPVTIDGLAISHGYYDHSGGLPALSGRVGPGTPALRQPRSLPRTILAAGGGATECWPFANERGVGRRVDAEPECSVTGDCRRRLDDGRDLRPARSGG